jgi:proteasome lid subunit RPN8/RPN11
VKLLLPARLADKIARQAQAAFPRECCGLIEGVWQQDEALALALHPAANRAAADERFEIDPALHLAAQRSAREQGHTLIGCYHSHPGTKPAPSDADRQGAVEVNFIWVIAGLDTASAVPDLRAFVYCDGDFTKIGVFTGADLVTSSSKDR